MLAFYLAAIAQASTASSSPSRGYWPEIDQKSHVFYLCAQSHLGETQSQSPAAAAAFVVQKCRSEATALRSALDSAASVKTDDFYAKVALADRRDALSRDKLQATVASQITAARTLERTPLKSFSFGATQLPGSAVGRWVLADLGATSADLINQASLRKTQGVTYLESMSLRKDGSFSLFGSAYDCNGLYRIVWARQFDSNGKLLGQEVNTPGTQHIMSANEKMKGFSVACGGLPLKSVGTNPPADRARIFSGR